MKLQDLDQRIPQLTAGHHLIHKAVFHLEFAALEPGGQFFTDGLLNDTGAGKADECPRFGERNITQTGKAGRDSACGGWVSTLMYNPPLRLNRSSAALVWPSASG